MGTRWISLLIGGCLLFGVGGAPAQAIEPLMPYDNFNVPSIDPSKWFGTETGEAGRDITREAARGRLRMFAAAYGDTVSDNGRRQERLRLQFTNPSEVTAIAANVRVMKARAQGCAANPDRTVAETRIGGSFFNSGTPAPGSHLNDIAAFIEVEQMSEADGLAGPLQVHAVVRQCTAVDVEEDCSDSTVLFSQNFGPVALGRRMELLIQWDQESDLFLFQRDHQAIVAYQYTLSDVNAPGKRLVVADTVANCTAAPRPVALMETAFDNIRVNASAAPK